MSVVSEPQIIRPAPGSEVSVLHSPLAVRGKHEEPASSATLCLLQANNLGGRSLFPPDAGRALPRIIVVSFGNGEFGSIPVSASSGCRPGLGPKGTGQSCCCCRCRRAADKFMGSPCALCNCMYVMVLLHNASAICYY